MTEADIAAAAIAWLKSQGFECYSEVPCYGGRADIVAVRQSVVWIVETKIGLSADLCLQCRDRLREQCNGVLAVAGGKGKSDYRGHPLIDWLSGHGIGFARVDPKRKSFLLDQMPKLRRVDSEKFRQRLCEQQKSNIAGTSGKYWTPFKDLVQGLQAALREGPLAQVGTLSCFRDYKTRSDANNKRALTDYLEKGLIPGWGIERRGRVLWIIKKGEPEIESDNDL